MTGANYALKSKVLREHEKWLKLARKAQLKDYLTNKTLEEMNYEGVVSLNPKENIDNLYIDAMFNGVKPEEWEEILKINKANYNRRTRLQNRVSEIITQNESLFLTITFNDDALNSSTPIERRKWIARYLKKSNSIYVANIDFGKTNHREHYHAVVGCNHVDPKEWKHGTVNFEHIRLKKDTKNDIVKISKYIAKLTNHAIKETTKRSALLYSR